MEQVEPLHTNKDSMKPNTAAKSSCNQPTMAADTGDTVDD
jgi:hypothetical protein